MSFGRDLHRPHTRAVLTVTDQALSSLSNFVLGVVVAAHVPVADYGRFAVVYSVYGITVGLCRAVASEPLVVRFAGSERTEQRRHGAAALGAGGAFGLVVGGLCALATAPFGGTLAAAGLVLGVGLPVLFVQDVYRYLLFALRRPHHAVALDLLWNVVFIGLLLSPALRSAGTPAPFLVAWVAAAVVSAATGLAVSAVVPGVHRAAAWLADHVDLGPRFAAESLVNVAGTHVIIYTTTLLAGFEAAGALRGAYVLTGPLWVATAGLVAAAVPEGVRLARRSPERLRAAVGGLTAVLVALSAAWGLLIVNLPPALGRSLLGDSWPQVQPLLTGLSVFGGGFVATSGLVAGLRALGAARRSFRATVPSGALVILGGTVGAGVAGAPGAVYGTVVPVWVGAAAAAWQLGRAVAQADGRATAPGQVR